MKNFVRATLLCISMMAAAAWSVPANATLLVTFTGDCSTATCFGSTYTLSIGDAGDAVSTTYDAKLKIDTTGYVAPIPPFSLGEQVYIDAVDIKVVTSLINNTFALTGAPGGASNWDSFFNNGQAATDCGSGGGFFFCARDPNTNTLAPVGGILEWDWTFSSIDAIAFGHIGASYNNETGTINGQNTSISNATTTKVPEPGTILMLGAGLLIIAGVARRFTK